MKRFFSPNSLAVLLFTAVLGTTLYLNGYFNPVPYGQVRIHKVKVEDGKVYFVANFIKLRCDIDAFIVYKQFLGRWDPVEYEDYPKDPPVKNRLNGEETLSIRFDGSIDTIDKMQMKARHICDGKRVDTVFAYGDLSDWLRDYGD